MGRPEGGIPWNKGLKTGLVPKTAFKKGHKAPKTAFKEGHVMSKKVRKKISSTLRIAYKTKRCVPSNLLGRPHSDATKDKISRLKKGRKLPKQTGEKHWNWKGGITPENLRIRHSVEYKLWRETVFKRDDWTCVWCKKRGVQFHADHIKPFALYPELRFAIDNGRTLCVDCHKKTDTYLKNYNYAKPKRKSD